MNCIYPTRVPVHLFVPRGVSGMDHSKARIKCQGLVFIPLNLFGKNIENLQIATNGEIYLRTRGLHNDHSAMHGKLRRPCSQEHWRWGQGIFELRPRL